MTGPPTFSIVIPTHNRPKQLAVCLEACARLDYPRDRFEVIAIDDGGTAALESIAASFQHALSLKLLRQENSGPAAARNRGALEAKGDFIAFTDDDCMPAPNWLKVLEEELVRSPDCAVGGQTLNILTHNLCSVASQLLIAYLFSYYNALDHSATFLTSNNLAFPAEKFRAVGGFDVTYPRAAAEDRELCRRWLRHGYRMTYASEAKVFHAHDLTLITFLRQHFHYGQGAFSFHRAQAQRTKRRIKVEPASFYLNMLSYPFVSAQGVKAPILTLLFMLAQIANALGFLWKLIEQRMEL